MPSAYRWSDDKVEAHTLDESLSGDNNKIDNYGLLSSPEEAPFREFIDDEGKRYRFYQHATAFLKTGVWKSVEGDLGNGWIELNTVPEGSDDLEPKTGPESYQKFLWTVLSENPELGASGVRLLS